MSRCVPALLLLSAVLLSGCEKKERAGKVYLDASTQDMRPFTGEGDDDPAPGLEGMPDDDQGTIYF